MILGAFEKAFYINLDRRTDRRANMEAILHKIDIEADRFPAVEYKDEFISTVYNIGIFKSKLAIYGCLESHLGVLEKAVAEKLSSVVVFEDDIIPLEALSSCSNVFAELTSQSWDAFWFYNANMGDAAKNLRRIISPPWGAYAYAINGHFIPKAIEIIRKANKPWWIWYPIDDVYTSLMRGNILVPEVDLVAHDYSFKSDIR